MKFYHILNIWKNGKKRSWRIVSAVFQKGNVQLIICLKSTIETPEQCMGSVRFGAFIFNFEQISYIALVCLLLTSNKGLPTG